MAVESDADLLAFFSPAEFGVEAVISTNAGDITIPGIIDSIADEARPGANSNSGNSPFLIGAADTALQSLQFTTAWHLVSAVRADDALMISTGSYAGTYRIKEPPQRDGEICRLQLNLA